MKVYNSFIEITLEPAFEHGYRRGERFKKQLLSAYELYPLAKGEDKSITKTDERALIELLLGRTEHKLARETGYVGSCHNCVFSLLYGIFRADILAFLFDQDWIPNITVDPFRPQLFLERLSILKRAAKSLTDGNEITAELRDIKDYVRPGMGSKLNHFNETRHRLLLDYSLRELQGFGELGLSLQAKTESVSVNIHIVSPDYDYDEEILRFARKDYKNDD
jgi:hypothetical protein